MVVIQIVNNKAIMLYWDGANGWTIWLLQQTKRNINKSQEGHPNKSVVKDNKQNV